MLDNLGLDLLEGRTQSGTISFTCSGVTLTLSVLIHRFKIRSHVYVYCFQVDCCDVHFRLII